MPLICILFSGCAYDREFLNDCHAAVPTIRDYAFHHLPDLTQDQQQVISNTEPTIGHANYVEVHFKWANICEVLSGAPPKCVPFKVIDVRSSR